MKKISILFVILGILLLAGQGVLAANGNRFENVHRFGGGIHYWKSLEDIIIEGVDEEGLALLLSYQYQMMKFFTVEGMLEFLADGYAGSDDAVFAPQVYVLVGRGIYAGAGIGWHFSDGKAADNPFFGLRAGLDVEIVPTIFLDLNVNYRSETWGFGKIHEDIQLNTMTLGAILRFEF